jgi:hypothetical protein
MVLQPLLDPVPKVTIENRRAPPFIDHVPMPMQSASRTASSKSFETMTMVFFVSSHIRSATTAYWSNCRCLSLSILRPGRWRPVLELI